jgi:predicted transposase YdaD
LEQAFDTAKMYSWNKKEMEVYDYIDLQKGSELDALRTAEQKGEKRGLKKGVAQGLEQGIEQGIEQERALGEKKREQEKIETAKNAIKQGLDNKTISAITELSPDEVEKLR